jgi:hypothetical protein
MVTKKPPRRHRDGISIRCSLRFFLFHDNASFVHQFSVRCPNCAMTEVRFAGGFVDLHGRQFGLVVGPSFASAGLRVSSFWIWHYIFPSKISFSFSLSLLKSGVAPIGDRSSHLRCAAAPGGSCTPFCRIPFSTEPTASDNP